MLQALIISGGLATRAGGINKSFMQLENRPIVEHQVERLRPAFGDRITVVTDRTDDYEGMDIRLTPVIQFPRPEAQASSLRGLVSALDPFPECWCFLLACDMPWPDPEILGAQIRYLQKNTADGASRFLGICLHDGKRFRPYHSLIHGSLGVEARKILESPDLAEPRSTRQWLEDREDIAKTAKDDLGCEKKPLKACISNYNFVPEG